MTDAELRDLVRESIARHLQADGGTMPSGSPASKHASHGVFQLARGSEGDGACLIEPNVACTHCRYCQSYGH